MRKNRSHTGGPGPPAVRPGSHQAGLLLGLVLQGLWLPESGDRNPGFPTHQLANTHHIQRPLNCNTSLVITTSENLWCLPILTRTAECPPCAQGPASRRRLPLSAIRRP